MFLSKFILNAVKSISLVCLVTALVSCVGNSSTSSNNLGNNKNKLTAPQPTIPVGFDSTDGSIAPGQANTSLSPMIILQFQFPMDISTINHNSVFLSTNPDKLENSVLLSQIIANAYGTEFSFYPVSPLKPFTKYFVMLTNQVTDPSGKYTVTTDSSQTLTFTTGNKDSLMAGQVIDRDNMVGNASVNSLISLRFNQIARICANRYDCKGYMNIKLHKITEPNDNLDLDFYYLGDLVLLRSDPGDIEANTNYEISIEMNSIFDQSDKFIKKFNFKTSTNDHIQVHSVTNGMLSSLSSSLYLFFSTDMTQVYGSQMQILNDNNKEVPFKIRCGLASCAIKLESDLQANSRYRMTLADDISDGNATLGESTTIQFRTDSWQSLPSPINHSKNPREVFGVHGNNNDLFLAYTDGVITLPTLQVYYSKQAGGTWSPFGPVVSYAANNIAMVIDKNNNPIIAFNEIEGLNSTVRVVTYDGKSWIDLLAKDKFYAENTIGSLTLKLDNKGNPVLSFADKKNAGKLRVVQYNAQTKTWQDYSKSYASTGLARSINLVFNSANNPILAYIDLYSGNHVKVVNYQSNTDSWVNVGDVSKMNNKEATSISMAIRSNDNIELALSEIVAYDDSDVFHNWEVIKPKVIEFDKNSWHALNDNQYWLANNSVDDLQLLVDNNTNSMVLAFNFADTGYDLDMDKGNSTLIMKYDFNQPTLGWKQMSEFAYFANFTGQNSITKIGNDVFGFVLPQDIDLQGMGIKVIKTS